MAKTIKVKELLNMEELPKEIKINGNILKRTNYSQIQRLYMNEEEMWWTNCMAIILNNEVEIIEDEQEIDIQRNRRNKRYSCFFINRCKKNY